jgi:YNFM family putative membrane transporter
VTDTHHPAGNRATGLLVFTALFVLTQLYLAIPLAEFVAADLGGTGTVFALATVFSLFYASGFLLWGPISDQWGRKRVMVPGVLALAISTAACAFAPSIGWMAGLRAVQGLAASSFAPVALAYLTEALPPQKQATAIGAMSTAFLVAGIFGQALASLVAFWWDWRWVFVITGAVLLCAGLVIRASIDEPASDRAAGRLSERFTGLASLSAQPRIILLGCAHITLLMSFVAMYSALGPHLVGLDFDPSCVIVLRLVGLPGMFATLAVGRLASRISMASVARAGYLIAAVGLVVEAALAQSLLGVAVGSLIFVTGVALAVPAMITLFGAAAAPNRAGGMSLNGFVLFVGASVGPLTVSGALGFSMLLAVLAFILVLAAMFVTLFARAQRRMVARIGEDEAATCRTR